MRVAFAAMEGSALGFKTDSLDLVTAVGTFEFVADLRPILREVTRVLVPGGCVTFTCWNKGRRPKLALFDRRPHGAVLWSVEKVREQAEESGLTIVDMESIFFVPRRLLWWSYRCLALAPLQRGLITGSIFFERQLSRRRPWAMAGRVLVVGAKKLRPTEWTHPPG